MAVTSTSLELDEGQFIGPKFLLSLLSQEKDIAAKAGKAIPYLSFPSTILQNSLAFFPCFGSTHSQ